jgi:hypothetical protein
MMRLVLPALLVLATVTTVAAAKRKRKFCPREKEGDQCKAKE